MLEHPEIGWIERTGYPSWMQEDDREIFDNDFEEDSSRSDDDADCYCDDAYEEARERELFGD